MSGPFLEMKPRSFETRASDNHPRSVSLSTWAGGYSLYITQHNYGGNSIVLQADEVEWLAAQLVDIVATSPMPPEKSS
jgi:hypothetical protein